MLYYILHMPVTQRADWDFISFFFIYFIFLFFFYCLKKGREHSPLVLKCVMFLIFTAT